MFSKDIYIQRRNALKRAVGSGILLFLGNEEQPVNYTDNQYYFRQDSSFLYFFDFHRNAGVSAIMDIDNNREVIFGDELTIDDIVWTGHLPTLKETAELVGVTEVLPVSSLAGILKDAISKGRKVHFLPPYRAEHFLKNESLLGIKPEVQKESASVEFIKAVVNLRNIKKPEEIEQIDKAAAISMQMHINAMRCAREGMKEYEVMSVVHRTALENGGQLSFPIICTTHGETLHNHSYGNLLNKGGMVLVDAGAEIESGYCGDISSSFPVGDSFSERQKTIYQIVYKSHYAAVDALKPGIPFKEVYYEACRQIVEGMKGIGLMKGDAHEAVLAGAHALFFQCGLGHMMGLDVHDMENLGEVWVGYDGVPKSTQFGIKSLRLARPLEPGFVLTIEPGVYFIPQLIEMWKRQNKFADFINYDEVEKWKDFGGIRNEEDYLITNDGHRLMGMNFSKEINDVEKFRKDSLAK